MEIAVLGTGGVGRTLAGALAARGHDVVLGSRDPAAALANADAHPRTGDTLTSWHEANPTVRIVTLAEAGAHGEILLNATPGAVSVEALGAAGAADFDGTIVLDVANPLGWSETGPTLTVAVTDSLGETLQRTYPGARIVKALNTVTAAVMVDPGSLGDGEHTLPICGDDAEAKRRVAALLAGWFGWRDVLDVGDITAARATEAYLLYWIKLREVAGTNLVSTKVVRST